MSEQKKEPTAFAFTATDEMIQRNRRTMAFWSRKWLQNTRENIPFILKLHDRLKDINMKTAILEIAERKSCTRFIILSSGPSADYIVQNGSFPYDTEDTVILASPSNASLLLAHDIVPDVILNADASDQCTMWISQFCDDPRLKDTYLFVPPTVSPMLIDRYPHKEKVRFYLSHMQGEDATLKNPYNTFRVHLFEGVISNFIIQAGCVTNQLVLLVTYFKETLDHDIKSVFLVGADYSFSEHDHSRCSCFQYHVQPQGTEPEADPRTDPSYLRHYVELPRPKHMENSELRRYINGVFTTKQFTGYRKSFMTLWALGQLPFFYVEDPRYQTMNDCLPTVSTEDFFYSHTTIEPYTITLLKEKYEYYRDVISPQEGPIN